MEVLRQRDPVAAIVRDVASECHWARLAPTQTDLFGHPPPNSGEVDLILTH